MKRNTQTIDSAKMYSGDVARLLLLKRRAGPLVREALRQDHVGDSLHGGDRLARAIPGGGLAGDLGRIVHVVMRNIDRAQGVLARRPAHSGAPCFPCG